jgi:hypothetical protein
MLFSGNDLWDITYAGGVRASSRKVTPDSVQDFCFDNAGHLHWDQTPGFWQKVGDFFANLGKDIAAFVIADAGFVVGGPLGAYGAGQTVGKALFGDQYWDYAARGGIVVGATALTIGTAGGLSEVTGPVIAGAIGGAAGSTFSAAANSLYFHSAFDWQSIVAGALTGAAGGGLQSLLGGSGTAAANGGAGTDSAMAWAMSEGNSPLEVIDDPMWRDMWQSALSGPPIWTDGLAPDLVFDGPQFVPARPFSFTPVTLPNPIVDGINAGTEGFVQAINSIRQGPVGVLKGWLLYWVTHEVSGY